MDTVQRIRRALSPLVLLALPSGCSTPGGGSPPAAPPPPLLPAPLLPAPPPAVAAPPEVVEMPQTRPVERPVEPPPTRVEAVRPPPPLEEPHPVRPLLLTPHRDETSPAPSVDGLQVTCLARPSGSARGPPTEKDRIGLFQVLMGLDGSRRFMPLPPEEAADPYGEPRPQPPAPHPPEGKIYFVGPGGGEIWSALPDGSERAIVAEGWDPQVSPDGRLLAFISARGGNPDLWILRLAESGLVGSGAMKPLLFGRRPGARRGARPEARIEGPAWSPRMDRIAFAADLAKGSGLDIFVVEIESGAVEAITSHPADDRDPAFLPDGEGGAAGILFSSRRGNGSWDLYFAET